MPAQLFVLEKARVAAKKIYAVIEALPANERFNLADQLRRAAISVISNLAEGSRRFHRNEKRQFYSIAFGSASELEAQLSFIKELNLAPAPLVEEALAILGETLRLLNRLNRSFR